ncbi:MAG TPA: branched-chain amino acid ABC transporter permease [Pseudorhizobium sp.]|nr:branched-chain amino acid ABC transporter permease [Pseudorhizobium sp.]
MVQDLLASRLNFIPERIRAPLLVIASLVVTYILVDYTPLLEPIPDIWKVQIVNAMTLGGLYALIAIGYTMVYGVLQMINFAHGEIFMLGAFAGLWVFDQTTDLHDSASALVILMAMIAAMAFSGGSALALERLAYRPLRRAPRLVPLISAIGASIFISQLVTVILRGRPQSVPRVFPEGSVEIAGIDVNYIRIFLIVMSFVFMFALFSFIRLTKTGKSIRAVAEDKDVAALMGINVDRTIQITFLLGAVLAGAAGVMYSLFIPTLTGNMGFIPGLKAFTAAVLGGIGNIPGAMVGGYFLAFAETLGVQLAFEIDSDFGTEASGYKDAIAFGLLVIVLIFRPNGIFGEEVGKKRA